MTTIINKQSELEALIDSNNEIIIGGNLKINCNVAVSASIKANDIDAWDIDAWDIYAWNIDAADIDAGNINAGNINAADIYAEHIDAANIKARNIKASDIDAENIDAWNIDYFSFCISYKNIICKSIEGRRENAKHFCLDGKLTIKGK